MLWNKIQNNLKEDLIYPDGSLILLVSLVLNAAHYNLSAI